MKVVSEPSLVNTKLLEDSDSESSKDSVVEELKLEDDGGPKLDPKKIKGNLMNRFLQAILKKLANYASKLSK